MNNKVINNLEEIYELLKNKDVLLSDEYSYSHPKKTKNKVINASLGRIWFNLILPENYPEFVDKPINKKELALISNNIYNDNPPDKAAEYLSKILKEGFKLTSIQPVSFTSDELIVPQQIIDEKKKILTKNTPPEEFGKNLKDLSNKLLDEHLRDSGIYDMIKSGSKGSPTELGILTIGKGPTLDITGKVSAPITSSLMEGYSGEEYYLAAGEARRTYYIRAVGTAEPGSLAREVVFANSNTSLTSDDCQSKKYMELFIKPDIAPNIIGRFYLDEKKGTLIEITRKNIDKLVNKTIKLRSPLFCKDKKGICKVCYGTLGNKLEATKIGLIAGSVINEAGVEGLIV